MDPSGWTPAVATFCEKDSLVVPFESATLLTSDDLLATTGIAFEDARGGTAVIAGITGKSDSVTPNSY